MIVLKEFETKTGGRLDAVDVTDDVLDVIAASGINEGTVLVFSPHTTCCVLVSRTDGDSLRVLEGTIEMLAPSNGYYLHDDLDVRTENLVGDEPANAPAHIAHIFLGKASECIPVLDGIPALGPGQRILFLELDASRPRRYLIQVVGR